MAQHCPTCICERRAPVQADGDARLRPEQPGYRPGAKGAGSISWAEHLEAYSIYAARYGNDQSAERLAERGGFSFGEVTDLLGREPTTWLPWGKK